MTGCVRVVGQELESLFNTYIHIYNYIYIVQQEECLAFNESYMLFVQFAQHILSRRAYITLFKKNSKEIEFLQKHNDHHFISGIS